MDSDDIAATRILARKMLRKKARNDIMDASYNRFVTHEDPSTLPAWFVENEAKHMYCERLQPTKEEMAEEKEAMCLECNCKAVTSSLTCISNAWQTFACNISHTNTCPGNFSLYQGYFGERS